MAEKKNEAPTKEELNLLIDDGLTQRQIAKSLGKSQTAVRHWLKKYGIRTKLGARGRHPKAYVKQRRCACGEASPDKFYGNKATICGKCHNKAVHKNGREKRQRAVDYLGGKCAICGWQEWTSGFDIHHVNPEEKDSAFHTMRYWSWERLEHELKKCILLCKCCHAGIHSGDLEL